MSNAVFLRPDENGSWGTVNTITAPASNMSSLLTFQSGATALGNGNQIDVSGYSSLSIQTIISGTATISFEQSVDNTNWTAATGQSSTTGSTSNSTSASVLLRFNIGSVKYFRARISAYTSGTVDVTGYASTGSLYFVPATGTYGSIDTNSTSVNLQGVGAYNLLFDGTNWVRQRSITATADGGTGGGLATTALMAFNGTSFDRVRTVSIGDGAGTGLLAQGQYVYDASGLVWNRVVAANGVSDGNTGTKTPASALLAYNGTTFDKIRTYPTIDTTATPTGFLPAGLIAYNSNSAVYERIRTAAVDGILAGVLATNQMGWIGNSFDRVRIGKVYKYVEYLNLANATATTIWTPTTGKKFRIMGVQFGSSAAAQVSLRDGTAGAGTPFHMFKVGGADTKDFSFGNGYISNAANNVLEVYNATGSTVSVWITAWGTEE